MRKLKIFFLVAFAIGLVSIGGSGCSKSNNNSTPSSSDSVLYSPWITLKMTPDAGDTTFEQNIAVKSLTQSILDKGTIMCYLQYQGQVNYSSDLGVYPTFTLGNINLFTGLDATGLQFRYVIIPGKTAVTDYKTIIKKYNIPIQ
ncbi:MAG TPA: hypothetical protein VGM30_08830 [Puia sp.]